MKLIRHKLREVSAMIVYVNCIIKSYCFCVQHPQTFLSTCILQVMMKVDLEDVTSRQVTINNIYFNTIESFSPFFLLLAFQGQDNGLFSISPLSFPSHSRPFHLLLHIFPSLSRESVALGQWVRTGCGLWMWS